MSDKRHHRTSRLLGAAGLAGCAGFAVLVGAPAAYARTSGPTVTFNGGGIGVLSCPSRPDTGRVSVREGNWVHVVNNTGYDANLRIGRSEIQMPPGAGRAVSLSPGRYTMRLEPSCLVNLSDADNVEVQVESAVVRTTSPTRKPSTSPGGSPGTGSPGGGTAGGGTTGGTGGWGGGPRSGASPTRPPVNGTESGRSDRTDRPGAIGAGPAGTPPTVLPTMDVLDPGLEGVPPPPGETPPAGGADGSAGDVVAVTAFEPGGDLVGPRRASRLLALIATVCVLGVTIAAFRAIVSQRTGRAVAA